MNQELIKIFRTQLGKKQYPELEGTWLELLTLNTPLPELLTLVELAIRWAPPELSITLLWVLADFLAEQNRFADELLVLRRLMELSPEEERLTRRIGECLRRIYPQEPLLERLIQKSGLGFGEPLRPALDRLDRYLLMLPGKMVYEPTQGTGTVKDLDLLFDRVVITLDNGTELTLDIATAGNRFRFPGQDSFFYLLKHQPEKLIALSTNEPGELVARFLKDIGRPAEVDEIAIALEPIVPKDRFPAFWERTKKELAKHPHIHISSRPPRRYQWQDEPKTETDIPQEKLASNKDTKMGLTAEQITGLSKQELLDAFRRLRTSSERKKLLDLIHNHWPGDWQELYSTILLTGTDSRTCKLIQGRLPEEKWNELVSRIVTEYRTLPDTFLLLASEIGTSSPRQVLNRLLDIMELDPESTRRNRAKKILTSDNYQLLRQALSEMEEADARRLRDRLKSSRMLEPFQQDEILTLIGEQFDTLVRQTPEEVVWTSAQGLNRAQAQLQHLTQIELPKSAEEIARARAFGDLSENYEYKAAKEKQARLMQQINKLQQDLSRARILEPDKINTEKVQVGCLVKLTADDGTVLQYAILGPWDSDHEQGIISFDSPLARKMLGKKPGDTITLDNKTLQIAAILRAL